jgi:hypothetical protein
METVEQFGPGSGIRDGKKSDPGYGINIPDLQHWIMILTLYRSESSMSSFSELGACGGGLSPQPQDLLGEESFHVPRLLSQDVCF